MVARVDFPNRVNKGSSATNQLKLRVPALWPSSNGHSRMIDVSYYLVVLKSTDSNATKIFEKPFEINPNSFDKESRLPVLIGTVPYNASIDPPPYTDVNEPDEELPMYENYQANNNQMTEVVVELESRRLTLPAIVPDLKKSGWSIGNFFGSLFGI